MKILCWNCRGLCSPEAVPVLRNPIRFHTPDVLFLVETIADASRVEDVNRRIDFDNALTASVIKIGPIIDSVRVLNQWVIDPTG